MPPEARSAPVLVTLVHGTFDVAAPWADAGSPICKAITQTVGSHLIIKKFLWSGNNSQEDRRAAAKKLLKDISDAAVYFPNSPHFLVGHSHGGNIVRWALELASPEASKNVAAAISVSTPFFTITPREYGKGLHVLFLVWRAVLTLSLSLGWLAFFMAPEHFSQVMRITAAIPVVGLLLAIGIPILIVYRLVTVFLVSIERRLLTVLDRRKRRLLLDNPPTVTLRQPFLCIHTHEDEVSYLFRRAHNLVVASRLLETFLSMAARLYTPAVASSLSQFKGWGVLFLMVAGLVVFISEAARHPIVVPELLADTLPLAAVGTVMSLAVPFSMAVGIWVYGTVSAQDLMIAHFNAAMTPTGARNLKITIVAPAVAQDEGISRWVHTGILYSEEVARVIAGFLKETIEWGSLTESVRAGAANAGAASPSAIPDSPASRTAVRYAGFSRRVLASVVDVSVLGIVWLIVLLPFLPPFALKSLEQLGLGLLLGVAFENSAYAAPVSWAYYALQESSVAQATLGKRLLRLRVTKEDGRRLSLGRATIRAWPLYILGAASLVGSLLGSAILLLAFIACVSVAFNARKQGVHDLMAGAVVTCR